MAISAGEKHTCALTLAGVVWCWGANGSYQLNQIATGYSPVPIASFGGAIAMSKIAVAKAQDKETREIAQKYVMMQEKDVAELEAWLSKHGKSPQ